MDYSKFRATSAALPTGGYNKRNDSLTLIEKLESEKLHAKERVKNLQHSWDLRKVQLNKHSNDARKMYELAMTNQNGRKIEGRPGTRLLVVTSFDRHDEKQLSQTTVYPSKRYHISHVSFSRAQKRRDANLRPGSMRLGLTTGHSHLSGTSRRSTPLTAGTSSVHWATPGGVAETYTPSASSHSTRTMNYTPSQTRQFDAAGSQLGVDDKLPSRGSIDTAGGQGKQKTTFKIPLEVTGRTMSESNTHDTKDNSRTATADQVDSNLGSWPHTSARESASTSAGRDISAWKVLEGAGLQNQHNNGVPPLQFPRRSTLTLPYLPKRRTVKDPPTSNLSGAKRGSIPDAHGTRRGWHTDRASFKPEMLYQQFPPRMSVSLSARGALERELFGKSMRHGDANNKHNKGLPEHRTLEKSDARREDAGGMSRDMTAHVTRDMAAWCRVADVVPVSPRRHVVGCQKYIIESDEVPYGPVIQGNTFRLRHIGPNKGIIGVPDSLKDVVFLPEKDAGEQRPSERDVEEWRPFEKDAEERPSGVHEEAYQGSEDLFGQSNKAEAWTPDSTSMPPDEAAFDERQLQGGGDSFVSLSADVDVSSRDDVVSSPGDVSVSSYSSDSDGGSPVRVQRGSLTGDVTAGGTREDVSVSKVDGETDGLISLTSPSGEGGETSMMSIQGDSTLMETRGEV